MPLLEKCLHTSRADRTEVVFVGESTGLTRIANSQIHQNLCEDSQRIMFRSILGRKSGVATTNSLVTNSLRQAMDASFEIARRQPDKSGLPDLPGPATYRYRPTFDAATASCSPLERARMVEAAVAASQRHGLSVAGVLSMTGSELAVVNSKGVRAYHQLSGASVKFTAMSATSSGYASAFAPARSDIDLQALLDTAINKCLLAQDPVVVAPGHYETILEPAAVASLLEWLNFVGFGSKARQEGTSCLCGRRNRKVTSDKITITDDSVHPRLPALPFDFEGVPRRKVSLISRGVATGALHDRLSAKLAHVRSTGHALPPDESGLGAIGFSIVMRPGRIARQKMITSVKRGILVTRFHYVNGFLDPRNSVMTGLTRDGTFLIENGRIVRGLRDLRFTDSILRAMRSTVAVSKEQEMFNAWWDGIGCILAPALQLGSFCFSDTTDHATAG